MKKALKTVQFSLLVSLPTVRTCVIALAAFCGKKRAVLAAFCGNERLLCGYFVARKDCFGGILWQEKGCFVGSDNLYLFGECVCIYILCIWSLLPERGDPVSWQFVYVSNTPVQPLYLHIFKDIRKKAVSRDFGSLFFHESKPSGPMIIFKKMNFSAKPF